MRLRIIKWVVCILVVGAAVAVLHYYLPGRDMVRIVGSDVKRVDKNWFGSKPAPNEPAAFTRDVRFINTVWRSGTSRVFRNEDTGWYWPPYLKFTSGNLQAQAQSNISTKAAPIWVVVTHYGWRIPIISMYPNAVKMRLADNRDELLIPWFNIVFLTSIALLIWMVWRFVRKLRRRHLDPLLDRVEEGASNLADAAATSSGEAVDRTSGLWSKLQRWLDTWRPKNKRRY